jgi:hypothetical protein
MRSIKHSKYGSSFGSRKTLRGSFLGPRHTCQIAVKEIVILPMHEGDGKCAQTPRRADGEGETCNQLDGQAAMLQAISIGRGIPMLEPWIIDEIRRREEERRRGDRPQLELPVPDPRWPNEGDSDQTHRDQGDKAPDRGVVIIGM